MLKNNIRCPTRRNSSEVHAEGGVGFVPQGTLASAFIERVNPTETYMICILGAQAASVSS
jgi:hypothetical protein